MDLDIEALDKGFWSGIWYSHEGLSCREFTSSTRLPTPGAGHSDTSSPSPNLQPCSSLLITDSLDGHYFGLKPKIDRAQ